MSNALALFKNGLPSFLQGVELDETTKALAGGVGGGKRISIKGSVFRMISGGEEVATNEDRAMNIIIVKASPTVGRVFYKGQYKEGENASPVCWSADGVKPAAEAPKKQSDKCAGCPMDVKGSGQGDSKACRYQQKLAAVLDGDVEGDVYEIALPATSIFGKADGDKMPLKAYAQFLASHNVPVTAVVTEMRFDTKSPTPKLHFKPVRTLTNDEWEVCREKAESIEATEAVKVTFTVKEDTDATAAPEAPKPKAAKPKPAPLPVAEPEEEEADEPEEPVKAPSKKAKTPAPADDADDMAALLDEWADD